ncbi:glutamine amidotransferase [Bifidobacterium commune]|uniref:Imidazole glycerol phosphate synthase subunit HisH n=1 Tax=Bifidobacterium commune TaxID=1505727 RepID=A0A1C4GZT4_9BIFI|nr:imidazole glycerol phosphate synthase subunit HisH [Bifidobacterium commune]MBB2955209.1 glutamine amidotransferase [Bifidobacterium commune]SCC78175.1 glutamine amidotransferase [Bifidobacterium commune]
MATVVVFDYGYGNVRSMMRALDHVGLDSILTSDSKQALEADGLVVPGVGAFAACMDGLQAIHGGQIILDRLAAGRPVLGVCVGLQVMFAQGVEGGTSTHGLGVVDGSVNLLDADVIPHMGWNTVEEPEGSVLLNGLENDRFYFVHSYAAMEARIPGESPKLVEEDADLESDGYRGHAQPSITDVGTQKVGWCNYGRSRFVASYERGPLSLTQFHPEKSGEAGAHLLCNWAATL